jgi:uncharacterized protein (DUF305 family)
LALLSVLLILLASCGGGQSSEQSGGALEEEIASSITTEATTEDATASTSEITDVPQVDKEGGTAVDLDEDRPFDLQFIDQMIVHHQMAIMSSEHMISDSERPELRQLSENIQGSQSEQIEQMQTWRDEWYLDAGRTSGMDNAMMENGIMGGSMQGEMGGSMHRGMGSDTADAMFLKMMIPHHQDAIDMSEETLERAEHPELKEFAQTTIDEQSAEIELMQGYLEET